MKLCFIILYPEKRAYNGVDLPRHKPDVFFRRPLFSSEPTERGAPLSGVMSCERVQRS
ncbi:Uncharacterised protein [Kluyvera cryocrescens]|uniref:Uncharacterized protein n=1 Tax=Kluyvera cryocrescens TaxID=580 RepID=A0A485AXV1_KLUCR|nr:Uncharacterised protein [Kluyvera cryocrescens]